MPIPMVLAAVLSKLAESGLSTLADAIEAKGKEVIEDKLGVKIPDKAEDLTPELIAQLQIKQMENEQFLIGAALKDVQDARAREVAINEAEGASELSKNITSILALIVVLGGGAILAGHADPEVRITAGNIMMLVLGYYFGTSIGSTKAQQALRDIVRKPNGA